MPPAKFFCGTGALLGTGLRTRRRAARRTARRPPQIAPTRHNATVSRHTKRSPGRGPRARRPGRDETPEGVLDAAVTAIVASIRRDGSGLAGVADPLEAELFASGILAMWHVDPLQDAEPLEILAKAVMERLADRPDPDALAVLLAVSALAPPPLDVTAREAVEKLRKAATPEPVWSRFIGRPTLVDAWISTDELDDQSNVLAAFAYDRRSPHALNLIIDANFQGLVRSVFVTGDPDAVRRQWEEVSGLPIRPLGGQALADLLGHGIEMFDLYLDPPVSEDVDELMPLLRARLRLLPTPRPIEPNEVSDEERAELVAAFAISSEATGMQSVEGGSAADLARWFVDFACDYGAGDPLRWSPIAVEIFLGDWLPRKAILEPDETEVLPEVLRRFVRFSARRKGLAEEVFAETLEAVDRFAPDFVVGMADDDRAGPAKQLARDLRASGIDLADQSAVQRWIDERNEGLPIQRT